MEAGRQAGMRACPLLTLKSGSCHPLASASRACRVPPLSQWKRAREWGASGNYVKPGRAKGVCGVGMMNIEAEGGGGSVWGVFVHKPPSKSCPRACSGRCKSVSQSVPRQHSRVRQVAFSDSAGKEKQAAARAGRVRGLQVGARRKILRALSRPLATTTPHACRIAWHARRASPCCRASLPRPPGRPRRLPLSPATLCVFTNQQQPLRTGPNSSPRAPSRTSSPSAHRFFPAASSSTESGPVAACTAAPWAQKGAATTSRRRWNQPYADGEQGKAGGEGGEAARVGAARVRQRASALAPASISGRGGGRARGGQGVEGGRLMTGQDCGQQTRLAASAGMHREGMHAAFPANTTCGCTATGAPTHRCAPRAQRAPLLREKWCDGPSAQSAGMWVGGWVEDAATRANCVRCCGGCACACRAALSSLLPYGTLMGACSTSDPCRPVSSHAPRSAGAHCAGKVGGRAAFKRAGWDGWAGSTGTAWLLATGKPPLPAVALLR